MSNILKKTNGKPWLTDENKTVPAKCPICGAKMGAEPSKRGDENGPD